MNELKPIKSEKLIKILGRLGFELLRQKGSHVFMRHSDGRTTLVPLHKNDVIDRGLLRKMIREDLRISKEEFLKHV